MMNFCGRKEQCYSTDVANVTMFKPWFDIGWILIGGKKLVFIKIKMGGKRGRGSIHQQIQVSVCAITHNVVFAVQCICAAHFPIILNGVIIAMILENSLFSLV